MPVSFVFLYTCTVTQRCRKRTWKVSLVATIWKYGRFTHDSTNPYDWWATAKRWKGDYISFLCSPTFYRTFKQKDSAINTSAITAVTKSFMKPWSGATANCHLCVSGERNGEQRRKKVSFDRTMMRALKLVKKACLKTKRHWIVNKSSPYTVHSLSG